MVTVAVGSFSVPPLAMAGDKIEFSSPNGSLAPPKVERDDRLPGTGEDLQLPARNDALMLGDYGPVSSDVVVISRAKKEIAIFRLLLRQWSRRQLWI